MASLARFWSELFATSTSLHGVYRQSELTDVAGWDSDCPNAKATAREQLGGRVIIDPAQHAS
jgi:hypothetical protein